MRFRLSSAIAVVFALSSGFVLAAPVANTGNGASGIEARYGSISQRGALEARGGYHDGPLEGEAAAIPDDGIPEDLRAELIPHWRRWTKVFYAVEKTLRNPRTPGASQIKLEMDTMNFLSKAEDIFLDNFDIDGVEGGLVSYCLWVRDHMSDLSLSQVEKLDDLVQDMSVVPTLQGALL